MVHAVVGEEYGVLGENGSGSQDERDKQVHVDVIPSAMEFPGWEP